MSSFWQRSFPLKRKALWNELTHFDASKVNLPVALRNTIGVGISVVLGNYLHDAYATMALILGSLQASFYDGSDAYRERAKRILATVICCATSIFISTLAAHSFALTLCLAVLGAMTAGMMVVLGKNPTDLATITLVTFLIFSGRPMAVGPAAHFSLMAMIGGSFQALLSLFLWPFRKYQPQEREVRKLLQDLSDTDPLATRSHDVPFASSSTQQISDVYRSLGTDFSTEADRIRSVLRQVERIRLSLIRLARLHRRLKHSSPEHPSIDRIYHFIQEARLILKLTSSPSLASFEKLESLMESSKSAMDETLPPFLNAILKDSLFQMRALIGRLRATIDLTHGIYASVESTAHPQPTLLQKVRDAAITVRANLTLRSTAFRHAVRLSACMLVAMILSHILGVTRSYWIPMTLILVLKPELSTTFSRGILRIAGTLLGLSLATGLFHFLPLGQTSEMILFLFFTFFLRWTGGAHYGLLSVTVSGLVVLLFALTGVSPTEVIFARGINTLLGGSIALLSYWLWPTWERTQFPEVLKRLLISYQKYFHSVARQHLTAEELDQIRRDSRTQRSNLLSSLSRLLGEAEVSGREQLRLSSILAETNRFAHAALNLEALRESGLEPEPDFFLFMDAAEKKIELLILRLTGEPSSRRDAVNLRDFQIRISPESSFFAETDRITNCLNTLTELIQAEAGIKDEK